MTDTSQMHVDKMSDRELRLEVKRLRGIITISDGLKCPNCDDVGFTAEAKLVPGYDGEGDVDWEQTQCEFCWTIPDSVFMRHIEDGKHYHVGPDDTCKECGLDLRNPIHKRLVDEQG